MNVYQKLAEARVRFQGGNPKMSGENTFAKYKYFELNDITPVINLLGKEIGFVCEVSFTDTLATLIFRDTDKPEDVITFTSPMSTAALKGCHEVQNLGAVETYIKRYLYQNAFEIVESDALNGTQGNEGKGAGVSQANNKNGRTGTSSEAQELSVKLEEWLTVQPPMFSDENARKVRSCIAANDVENMRKWLAWAAKRNAEA